MARLTKVQREELLSKLRNGHTLEGAAAALGITETQIEGGGGKLSGEIKAAFKVGTAKLEALHLEWSVTKEDGSAIARLIDKREQTAAAGKGITKIERVIVYPACPACGHKPNVAGRAGHSIPYDPLARLATVLPNESPYESRRPG